MPHKSNVSHLQNYKFATKNADLADSHLANSTRQLIKWKCMAERGLDWFILTHPTTFKRRLKKGIPQEFRWAAWRTAIRARRSMGNELVAKEETTDSSHLNIVNSRANTDLSETCCDSKSPKYVDVSTTNSKIRASSAKAFSEGSPIDTSLSSTSASVKCLPPYISIDRKKYAVLSTKTSSYTKLIETDVSRTFPDTEAFDQKAERQLSRLLNAFANYKPRVGYCQGINFVVGFLLMISNYNELETFEVLIGMMETYYLECLFYENFPLLRKCTQVFDSIMKQINIGLYEHFQDEKISPEMYLHQWILTIFVQGLPLKTTAVVWDYIIAEGLHAIIVICVSLLQILQRFIINSNLESTIRFLKSLKRSGRCDGSQIGRLLVRQADKIELPQELLEPLLNLNIEQLYQESLQATQGSLSHNVSMLSIEYEVESPTGIPLLECFSEDSKYHFMSSTQSQSDLKDQSDMSSHPASNKLDSAEEKINYDSDVLEDCKSTFRSLNSGTNRSASTDSLASPKISARNNIVNSDRAPPPSLPSLWLFSSPSVRYVKSVFANRSSPPQL